MLAVGPAMDGEFPQHEAPPAGSVLYSPPPLQTRPLCGSSVQVSPAHSLGLEVGCCPQWARANEFLKWEPLGFFYKGHDWPSESCLGLAATFTCGTLRAGTPVTGHGHLFSFNVFFFVI